MQVKRWPLMQDERDNRPAQAAKRDVDSPRPTPYMVPSLVKHLRFGPWLGPERFRARDEFDEGHQLAQDREAPREGLPDRAPPRPRLRDQQEAAALQGTSGLTAERY